MGTDTDAVLAKVIRVFARDRGASMGTIASRVGVSRATLVRLYATREGMVAAMASQILADCERVLDEARLDEAPAHEALGVLVRDYAAFAQLWSVVYVEPEVLGSRELSAAADDVVERITAFVTRGQESGFFRADMPATWLASTLCALAEAAWELVGDGHMGARQAPDFIATILLRGGSA